MTLLLIGDWTGLDRSSREQSETGLDRSSRAEGTRRVQTGSLERSGKDSMKMFGALTILCLWINYLDQLEVSGCHFEIWRQIVVWPTMMVVFTEMLCATTGFTPP